MTTTLGEGNDLSGTRISKILLKIGSFLDVNIFIFNALIVLIVYFFSIELAPERTGGGFRNAQKF